MALLVVSLAVARRRCSRGLGHGGKSAADKPRRRPPAEVTVEVAPPKPAPPPPAARRRRPRPRPPRAGSPFTRRRRRPRPRRAAARRGRDAGGLLGHDADQRRSRPRLGLGDRQRRGDARPDRYARRQGHRPIARGRGGSVAPARAVPVVALASLSRPPAPPDLNAALERHYPEAARRQGTPGRGGAEGAGHARRPRPRSGGRLRRARPASATPAGPRCATRSGARRSTATASRSPRS